MRACARAFAALAVTALAACGQPASKPAEPAVAPGTNAVGTAPSSSEPAGSPPVSPLGAGRAMSGSVSPLAGLVTAFQVEETATQIIVDLAADVLFAFDSADLSVQAPEQLRKTVAQIKRGGPGEIQIVGHTDSQGEDAYNDALSLRRAQAVSRWLSAEADIPDARLKAVGRGERDPVAPNEGSEGNDYAEGRAMNRRVQVIIPKS